MIPRPVRRLRCRWWLARLRLRGRVTREDGSPLEGQDRLDWAATALTWRKSAAEPSYDQRRTLP
jgi:hypothetical protein